MKNNNPLCLKGRNILVAASGSIAAVKTPLIISELIKSGAVVQCILTPSASRLISPLSVSTLSRNRCYLDEDQWSHHQTKPLHIELAEWADLILIAPLSASSLAKWALGIADGLLASVLLAAEKPSIAVPAMNSAMWANPSIKQNWEKIKTFRNVISLEPSSGLLACDRIGDGRMTDPELIQLSIKSALIQTNKINGELNLDWKGKSLLATAGCTQEALDPARLITNRSSGRMGVLIAQAARFRGAEVQLVHGPLQTPPSWLEGLKVHSVKSASEMHEVLKSLQPFANVVTMAAAVADFRKKGGEEAKKLNKDSLINSLGQIFEPVPDLLAELVQKRPKGQLLLGFSALTGDDDQIKQLGELKRVNKGCDLLFANPIDREGQGFDSNFNSGYLLGPQGMAKHLPITSKLHLAHQLLDALMALQVNISDSNK